MRRNELDGVVLEYMIRDRFKSCSPKEITGDPVFAQDVGVLRVKDACERLWRAGLLDRKRHTNPLRSRYKIAPGMFEVIIGIVHDQSNTSP